MPSVYLPMAKGIRCPKNVTFKKNHVLIWMHFTHQTKTNINVREENK